MNNEKHKFKVGDKAFHVLIGEVFTCVDVFNNRAYWKQDSNSSTLISYLDGKAMRGHKLPGFIPLEEARKRGYDVPREKVKFETRGSWSWSTDDDRWVFVPHQPDLLENLHLNTRELRGKITFEGE